MENNVYYNGKHSSYMLPSVNYPQIQFDSYTTDYQASSHIHQQHQQQQQQLPHQVQTTHQHHDVQSTISVKLDTINKSPPQKNDEIQACSGGYTGNNSTNDFHGNLYQYNKSLDNSDGIATYNQASVVSNYSDFDHIGGSSIGHKSLSSFILPHQQQHQSHHQQQSPQVNQQQVLQTHQTHNQHPPTAAIVPQAIVNNDISSQQSKVLGTFDQRASSKCYNSKTTTATNSPHGYQQSTGYKDSDMSFNYNNKLPPIPQTYHHVYTPYDKYSIQSRSTSHHKSYEDTNSRPFVCQAMPLATNHKPSSQSELFCNSSATTEQHNRFSNRSYSIPNSAFTAPTNGYFVPMYHRSNNVARNLSLPPPLQPAIDDSSSYYHNNNLLLRSGSYNRSQMAFQPTHYSYARSHPMTIPKLQSKNDIDIMSGLTTEEIYHRPYNGISYEHYDEFQYPQVPTGTHYPKKSSNVIFAPYTSNSMNTYPPSTAHQQTLTAQQQQPPQQQHHNQQQQSTQSQPQHHQSVIQNQIQHSANDYSHSRYACSNNVQPSTLNCSSKVYLQDQYPYATHGQMIYPHSASEVTQTELTKYNQIYDTKHTTPTIDKLALVDLEEQITGSKILKTRELAPTSSYDCTKSNYRKDQYIYNYNVLNNSYQQMRGTADQEASKNQSIRDYLATWNDDEEDDGETVNGIKKANPRRIAAVDVMSRGSGQSKLDVDSCSTTKIHFGIKVDNGGIPTKNLPDIIIDIEKPKVVSSDTTTADKLYVLESIDVPFSDLNKYKHLSVVNKLPDNIVQIDRRKVDKLDDVEETLKLIEKCEERVRQHKSDFELNAKFDSESCVSPVQPDCPNQDADENVILSDPLSIHETPVHGDQHIVPASTPIIGIDEETTSNAQTADDCQMTENIDEDEAIQILKDGAGEVVRYKCVQRKVSTNGDDQIHSDDSIPKLKLIKIVGRKRSKSFRNRKNRSGSDSFDSQDESKLIHLDETTTTSKVKPLKVFCLDVINTSSFRKYLISLREVESQNVFQCSVSTSIESHIECHVESKENCELIDESIEANNVPSDLIESKTFSNSPLEYQSSDDDHEIPSNVRFIKESDKLPHDEIQSTFDNSGDSSLKKTPSYDFIEQRDTIFDDSLDIHPTTELTFQTPFADSNFDPNFDSIRNELSSSSITDNCGNEKVSPFLPIIGTTSANVDNLQETENSITLKINTTTEQNKKCSEDCCMENIMDNLIDNFEKPQSIPSNCVEDSELLGSFNQFENLIGTSDKTLENDLTEEIVVKYATDCPNETLYTPSVESTINDVKAESYDTGSASSSSCSSSSDESNYSDSCVEKENKRRDDSIPFHKNNEESHVRFSNTSYSSSDDESEDDKSSVSSLGMIDPNYTHTDSKDRRGMEHSSDEMMIMEPKIKIEKEENEVNSKLDDQISRSSDNEFRSSSYSSSSSENSDDSSSDSDDETVSDSVSKITENKVPDADSLFVAVKIKAEDALPYSDTTTDESSMHSCDVTPVKHITTNGDQSVKSNSSSESSDDEDEYVERSAIQASPTNMESYKTSSDTDHSEDDDKKSCSTNSSSSVASVTDKHDSLSESVTESETCTDCTATSIPIARKNSSTNSDDKYVQNSSNENEKQVTEDFVQTKRISESNSCSDNSDDEYVKLSPLNQLDECSSNSHTRKLSILTNKDEVTNTERNKKPILSSDSYTTSSSSSSSSSSSQSPSTSDEYSSDDDEVFKSKPPLALRDVNEIVTNDSTELKVTETEEKDVVQTNQEDHPGTLSNVEEEVVHDFGDDLSVDACCHDSREIEQTDQPNNDNDLSKSVCIGDESPGKADSNSETERYNDSKLLQEESDSSDHSSIRPSEQIIVDSKICDENILHSRVNEEESNTAGDITFECRNTEDIDRTDLIESEKDYKSHSLPTFANVNSIDSEDRTIADVAMAEVPSDADRAGFVESRNEIQIDLQNLEKSRDENSKVNVTSSPARNEGNSDNSAIFDEQLENNSKVSSQIESVDVCENVSDDTPVVYENRVENSPTYECNTRVSKDVCVEQSELTANHKQKSEIVNSHCNPETEENDANITGTTLSNENNVSLIEKLVEMSQEKSTELESISYINELEDKELPSIKIDDEATSSPTAQKDVIFPVTCSNENNVSLTEKLEEMSPETSTELESISHVNEVDDKELRLIKFADEATSSPTAQKDSIYPVLDIPVKLIPLPNERFNEELYQKLIDSGEIFPSRKADEIDNLVDFFSKIPVELIPLPGETIDEEASGFIEFKQKYLENRKNVVPTKIVAERISLSEPDQYSVSTDLVSKSALVIYDSIPSLKVLCEKVLCVAGLHYDEDDDTPTSVEVDDENISYLYIVNDSDDFWNCSDELSSPLIVCYDGELDDDVFVESDFTAPTDLAESQANFIENCPHSVSLDSFTIDSQDIQYEEIVPVNRTMYKLETFKRYLQSKYIQKPNYIQAHCIKKILKKYSNYQRYRKDHAPATVQKCKKRIQNYKNLIKQTKSKTNNVTSSSSSSSSSPPPLLTTTTTTTDGLTVKDNGNVPKNDVLRSNCDINKSKKLLLLTNNNIKNKKNLNSTQRSHKLKECEVSAISSYVSKLTKNNHLKESRAFAKEIITNKRSVKSSAKVTAPVIEKFNVSNPSHDSPANQLAIPKRKVSEIVVEAMLTRNNKKRKLSFDDTLLGINRIYKQSAMIVECDRVETKSSGSFNKQSNSNILNNSKDKVRRLVIPKSKIFDGPNEIAKNQMNHLEQIPYVKLIRNPYIDSLGRSYGKTKVKSISRK